MQFEDPAVVKSKPLPNRVAALDRRIEWADASLIPMDYSTVDVDENVAVASVKFLEHGW